MKKSLVLMMLFALAFASCEKSSDDTTYNPAKDGIVGQWYSSKTNVAPILTSLVDSIYAKFNADQTYLVESFKSGSKTTMTGTFTQVKPTTGNIWEISLNQSTPTTLTSEGIFEINITNDPYTMKYEVAQTSPVITGVTKPTVAGGFGSTSGGAFGILNIQNYIRIK